MMLRRELGGFSVAVRRRRLHYWAPRCWVPLSVRGRMRWWGAVTVRREAP